MSTKVNKYVVNQKLEHVDDINFRELLGKIRVFWFFFFLQYSICPFLVQGICIYVGHSFYETQLDQLPEFVLQLRVRNSCVEGREVKCFNAIAGGEGPRL